MPNDSDNSPKTTESSSSSPKPKQLSLKEKIEYLSKQPGWNPKLGEWFTKGAVVVSPVRGESQESPKEQGQDQNSPPVP